MSAALGLDHLVLVVDDVERTLDWYGRYSGLAGERVDEWHRGDVFFPSLRIDATTRVAYDLVRVILGRAAPDSLR